MNKCQVTKVWIWGGAILAVGSVFVTASSLGFAFYASDLPAGETDGLFWTWITLIVASSVIGGVGLILQTVAWVGALFNARNAGYRTWYRALFWGGVVSGAIAMLTFPIAAAVGSGVVLWVGYPVAWMVGAGVMIAYLVGGPDRPQIERPPAVQPAAPSRLAHVS